MSFPICETCGTQYADVPTPPTLCPVCQDERQYVGWNGQTWTTHAALADRHTLRIEDDQGVLGIGLSPGFAINQRAILLPTDAGNILWECLSLVTDEAVAALKARGGVDYIAISHPHFYASMVEWSQALGGVPILLHEADREWVFRPSPLIRFWSGDVLRLSDSVTLLRCGGHFAGSTAIHWRDAPRGGALFPGDALQVVLDRRHVTFMYSYPNYIPMRPRDVQHMKSLLDGYAFSDVYGYTWGRNIIGGGREAVDASFARYLQAVAA
ncbi:MBL fold metallo-hydrolase [Montanilutibacter psychrotolerans]|uniref:MBL fold metallo-hydrolase n=1 Tax=Montanilutibacter psychrotolerans TaxID=1327343 RepID=A0A3M8SRR6_9GAMM|nr:MBL fold metallo-hydrolase [Lysobacter psychrotolerans]RNF81904.1 MBL fold metallo-hydrolase [Lysobacter psychrotolerans]